MTSVRCPVPGVRVYGSLPPVGLGQKRLCRVMKGEGEILFTADFEEALKAASEDCVIETKLVNLKFRPDEEEARRAYSKTKKCNKVTVKIAKNLAEEKIYSKFEDIFDEERRAFGHKEKSWLKKYAFFEILSILEAHFEEKSDLTFSDIEKATGKKSDSAYDEWHSQVSTALSFLLRERYEKLGMRPKEEPEVKVERWLKKRSGEKLYCAKCSDKMSLTQNLKSALLAARNFKSKDTVLMYGETSDESEWDNVKHIIIPKSLWR